MNFGYLFLLLLHRLLLLLLLLVPGWENTMEKMHLLFRQETHEF